MISKKPSFYVYQALLPPLVEKPSHIMKKWAEELNIEYDEDCFGNSIAKLYASSMSSKVCSFQFRLVHKILSIYLKLYMWEIVESY